MIGEHGRTTGTSKLGFEILNWVGSLNQGNQAIIVIYNQARVNGGSNYEYARFPS